MQGCRRCSDKTNSRLSSIEEKLNTLLTILPELETYKKRIALLEEENKSLQTSLENSQAEIEDLKTMLNSSIPNKKLPTPPVNASSASLKSYIANT